MTARPKDVPPGTPTSIPADEDYVVSGSLAATHDAGTDLTFSLISGPAEG